MTVVCEIPLRSGSPCGVPSVGRCLVCEHAMCESHRYIFPNGTLVVDRCRPCIERANASEQQRLDDAAARAAESTRREQQSIRTFQHGVVALARALVRAGSPGQQRRYGTQRRTTEGKWYRPSKLVDETVELSPGWAVGLQPWQYNPRDLDVRLSYPVYHSSSTIGTMQTWVLEDGRLVYDGKIDGDSVFFAGAYDHILAELVKVARRHDVDLPWDVQELWDRLRSGS